MVSFKEFIVESFNGFQGEFMNALFLGVLFAIIVSDLRKYFPLERFFEKFKVKNFYVKSIFFLVYYVFLLVFTFVGVFLVISLLWVISFIM